MTEQISSTGRRLRVAIAGDSCASYTRPNRNIDAFFVDERSQSLGVFDGVGTVWGAEYASQTAAETVSAWLGELPTILPRSLGRRAITEALMAAHDAIIVGNRHDQPVKTTAAVAKLFHAEDGAPYVVTGHVGDSRVYRMRQGELDHLTLDHTPRVSGWANNDPMLMQEILSNITSLQNPRLSEEARVLFRHRYKIHNVMGDPAVLPTVDVNDYDVRPDDMYLATTDGVHDNLTTEEMEGIFHQSRVVGTLVKRLVGDANMRSKEKHDRAKADDITAAVMAFQ